MRLIKKHELDETVLTEVLGWKWIAFVGVPVKGTDGYPEKQRVRQLFSPKQLKSKQWIKILDQNDGRPATGDEPLAYCYCSSAGPAIPPRVFLLIDD